eukprot:1160625-Prorocentrum_minimum.AAC.1
MDTGGGVARLLLARRQHAQLTELYQLSALVVIVAFVQAGGGGARLHPDEDSVIVADPALLVCIFLCLADYTIAPYASTAPYTSTAVPCALLHLLENLEVRLVHLQLIQVRAVILRRANPPILSDEICKFYPFG